MDQYMEDETSPLDAEVSDAPVLDAGEAEDTTPEVEFDDEGNPVEPDPEDDTADIEHDGKTFKVPKELKDAFLRQADYTRKTQEVAEMRRAVEATLNQSNELSQAEKAIETQFIGVSQALQAYQSIDWQTWTRQDPIAAQNARYEYDDLRQQQQQLAGQFQQAQGQRLALAQQETARRLAEGQQVLAQRIPNWGAETQGKLAAHAAQAYGFTAADFNSPAFSDPRVIIALHDAFQFHQQQQRTKTATRIQQQEAIQPAAKVKGKAPAFRGLDDRMSTDAWIKEREKQLAKRR